MRRLREWLGRLIRDHLVQDEPMAWTDFYGGGPKDGDREQLGTYRDEWVCVVAVPIVLSPWGRDDRDDYNMDRLNYDPARVVVTGRYVRTGSGMAWRPA